MEEYTEYKISPKPWRVVNRGTHYNNPQIDLIDVVFGDDEQVADDIVASGTYTEANAYMIASAPDMYDYLELMVEQEMINDCSVVREVKKLMAKARGE